MLVAVAMEELTRQVECCQACRISDRQAGHQGFDLNRRSDSAAGQGHVCKSFVILRPRSDGLWHAGMVAVRSSQRTGHTQMASYCLGWELASYWPKQVTWTRTPSMRPQSILGSEWRGRKYLPNSNPIYTTSL